MLRAGDQGVCDENAKPDCEGDLKGDARDHLCRHLADGKHAYVESVRNTYTRSAHTARTLNGRNTLSNIEA